MCGRYAFHDKPEDARLAEILRRMEERFPGQYKTGELFPGDTVPAIISLRGRLRPVPAEFGFPAHEGGKRLINARAETAASKPSFAESLRERRIILPADGFFEWSRGAQKTKYCFTAAAAEPLYLCGLYQVLEGRLHFVILTREANPSMAEIHDRMPVIAGADQVRPYLTDLTAAMAILENAAPVLRREQT